MSLHRSRRGRPVLHCDVAGCGCRFATRAAGEDVVVLRLRASLRGWRRLLRKLEVCPRHTVTMVVDEDGRQAPARASRRPPRRAHA